MCENSYVRMRIYFTNLSAVRGACCSRLRQQANEEKVATDILMMAELEKMGVVDHEWYL